MVSRQKNSLRPFQSWWLRHRVSALQTTLWLVGRVGYLCLSSGMRCRSLLDKALILFGLVLHLVYLWGPCVVFVCGWSLPKPPTSSHCQPSPNMCVL